MSKNYECLVYELHDTATYMDGLQYIDVNQEAFVFRQISPENGQADIIVSDLLHELRVKIENIDGFLCMNKDGMYFIFCAKKGNIKSKCLSAPTKRLILKVSKEIYTKKCLDLEWGDLEKTLVNLLHRANSEESKGKDRIKQTIGTMILFSVLLGSGCACIPNIYSEIDYQRNIQLEQEQKRLEDIRTKGLVELETELEGHQKFKK